MTDLDEFIRSRTPGTKRSRLYPYLYDIKKLRREGFSYEQVCEYLGSNGITITVSGLASYLKRQEATCGSIDIERGLRAGGTEISSTPTTETSESDSGV